jgi:hypothetical protein
VSPAFVQDIAFVVVNGAAPNSTPVPTPTAAATNTPPPAATNTPVPSATSTPVPTAIATQQPGGTSFTTTASAAPSTVWRGNTVSITTSVKSATASNAVIDLEVFDASGTRVFQKAWDAQSFTAGQTQNYTATWSVPQSTARGSYTIKVGVFSLGWTQMYAWNDSAGKINVK